MLGGVIGDRQLVGRRRSVSGWRSERSARSGVRCCAWIDAEGAQENPYVLVRRF